MNVFSYADRWLQMSGKTSKPSYSIELLAEQAGPVTTSSSLKLVADRAIADVDEGFDTLIVAGGVGMDQATQSRALTDWIKTCSARSRRTVSICTGAFLLAECGLLDNCKATTHWLYCERFAQEYPRVQVKPDCIFIRQNNIYTSGGITAGIDLTLSLVEEDWGSEVANYVARVLLVFLRRPGGQSQFSSYLPSEAKTRMDIRELQSWIINHPSEDLSVDALASRLAMSPRNFTRIFVKEVGITPASFVEQVRLSIARTRIEQSKLPLKTVCEQCGFGSDEHMRRAFQRHLKISPQAYRERFHFQQRGEL
jgi:transcriptional regulator GlxA family with amidase domain